MTATFLVGDVHERQAELIARGEKFDLIITSPPFLALRSYLPDDHPDKAKEIGSESTPADYLNVLLALTAEWRRLLAPHGSIAVELGDTYAGSGGAGGDYNTGGFRDGQQAFDGSAVRGRPGRQTDHVEHGPFDPAPVGARKRTMGTREHRPPGTRPDGGGGTGGQREREMSNTVPLNGGPGWPLDKSLCGIPTLYAWSLAYGRNLLTGAESPAGQWRIRNLKPWIRSNPPVGALGDKERPATSYITVATLARDRWFDLDAVRTPVAHPTMTATRAGTKLDHDGGNRSSMATYTADMSGGAPPLDWWHHVDAIIDHEINQRAGQRSTGGSPAGKKHRETLEGGWHANGAEPYDGPGGARGVHIRRALEKAGILQTQDALDISPKGYAGAHYAVWPKELVRLLVDEMAPRRVCTVCGEPSTRLTEVAYKDAPGGSPMSNPTNKKFASTSNKDQGLTARALKEVTTLGWSDCDCPELDEWAGPKWRPGRILDPFVGSGTTLAVATGMGRDAVGIDLDPRNAHLAEQRCGMFLEVDWGRLEPTTELPPDEVVVAVSDELL